MAKMKPLFGRYHRGHIKVFDRGSSLLEESRLLQTLLL